MKLEEYLLTKQEQYEKFDLFKAHRFMAFSKLNFKNNQKVIQILGTNGKGSTGRYLALMLANSGYRVGHFISPHIFSFKERFSIYDKNTKPLDINHLLEIAHEKLSNITNKYQEELSYFEYLCFLSVYVFETCDYVVFEAGLGGEYDATSVFKRDLCVFTPIRIDHVDLLGDNLDSIIRTKIKAMCDDNIFYDDYEIIKKAACLKKVKVDFLKHNLSKQCLDEQEFLKNNFSLANLAYFHLFNHHYINNPIKLDLKGRCELISPNILVDVGHNEHAAMNLVREIKNKFDGKAILICNFFANKDVKRILSILKESIKEIHLYSYTSPNRALANIKEISSELNIPFFEFNGLNHNNNYVVFGSFMLVEKFMKDYYAGKII